MHVPLHSHSHFSVLDGLFAPEEWASAYKDNGFRAAALTDHGTLGGLLSFYYAMKKHGLIPIMGSEFYFNDNPAEKIAENRKARHLILLAKDYDGFQNLMELSRLSFTEGFYYKPRIGPEWLSKFNEGLVCLTACQGGILSNEVWREKAKEPTMGLEKRFQFLSKLFGDDLYVEFQGHNTLKRGVEDDDSTIFNSQELINKELYTRLSGLGGFKPVITNDNHYLDKKHAKVQTAMKAMAYKSGNNDAGQSFTHCDSLWLKKDRDIVESFFEHHSYFPREFVVSGVRATEEVFEKCKNFKIPTKKYLPLYRKEINSADFFKALVKKNFSEFLQHGKKKANTKEYLDRFIKEFEVISKHGLQDYFLIVWDICNFARKQGILTGIGRGSAAGSLISYLLGIVKIDLFEYGLIFERFLNENRCVVGELPDIDLDVESLHRDVIKEYIVNKYGRENVCEIGTYGRMQLRTSILDVGKFFGVADHKALIDITTHLSLGKEENNSLAAAAFSDQRLKKLLDDSPDFKYVVSQMIGQIKSQGIHPAGMIICSEPVHRITPIKTQKSGEKDKDGKEKRIVTTQTEDVYLVSQGIMKLDVLGLKEYDVIRYVIENTDLGLTSENYLEKILGTKAPEVWEMFQEGRTEGVFQFSSQGMQQLLKDMKPNCIQDLMAANSLYRPGCLENGWHLQYCARKHDREPVEYIHPVMEPILKNTYGVCVYQEQFMEAFHRVGDISLVDSDTIRYALGKKDKEKLDKFKTQFVDGAAKKIGESAAEELWERLSKA